MTFRTDRWYPVCDNHRKKLEHKNVKGTFEPHEDGLKCEWKKEIMIDDKRASRCYEDAKWDFIALTT